ncbi:HEPN domain-containing protein [Empedobacter tilapiae]|uniref:HEPN domain-containing protein n=1 Tax=Empedobacter tilapiae TaxID=2491114 RepID=A0A4Z1B6H8_9FLAO|nr:HEPN domain-containing protein [Empedobacter tilapiae]TGN29500.1 HEPN domain-containing protein [Empedobacter tilapiae]
MNTDYLFQLSFEDLKVSKLTYTNGNFSNSLYHFHQSQEKLIKSIALKINLIEEKDLKKISHNFIKLYDKYIEYIKTSPIVSNLINEADLMDIHEKSKQLEPSEFVGFIVNEYCNILENEFIRDKEDNESHFDLMVDYFKNLEYIDQMPDFQKVLDFENEDEIIKKYIKEKLEEPSKQYYYQIKYGPKILLILIINCIFCSYYKPDDFRYSSEKIKNPIEYFNDKTPIVISLKALINNMIELYKIIPQIEFQKNYV